MATEIVEGEFQEEETEKEVVEEVSLVKEARLAIAQGKAVMGMKSTIKELKEGRLSKVIFTKNLPLKTKKEIQDSAKLSGTALEEFEGDSTEFGMECKRSHTVLLFGIKKE